MIGEGKRGRRCRRAAEISETPCPPLGPLIERDRELERGGGMVPEGGEGSRDGAKWLPGNAKGSCEAATIEHGHRPCSSDFFKK